MWCVSKVLQYILYKEVSVRLTNHMVFFFLNKMKILVGVGLGRDLMCAYFQTYLVLVLMVRAQISPQPSLTLVNVNAPVVATTSWWLLFSAPVVA